MSHTQIKMTNNKTEFQETFHDIVKLWGKTYDDVNEANEIYAAAFIRHIPVIFDALIAAQAYADLPEKIDVMRRPFSRIMDDYTQGQDYGYNQAIDDILNLLKDGA